MRVPTWARWALAVILVVGIATAGVAANLAVLGSTDGDTRLGTLSARSIAPDGTPIPRPAVSEPDDDDSEAKDREGKDRDDDHEDDSEDD